MINFQMLAYGAAGGAALAAMTIWPIAHGAGEAKAERAAMTQRAAAERVINRVLAERDQARAEVVKVSAAMAAQAADLAKVKSADEVERAAAITRMEKAVTIAARESKRAGEQAYAAREAIKTFTDACVQAGVSADVVRLLNNTFGDPALGNGAVSAPAGRDR